MGCFLVFYESSSYDMIWVINRKKDDSCDCLSFKYYLWMFLFNFGNNFMRQSLLVLFYRLRN